MNTRRRGSLTPCLSEGGDRVINNASTNAENFEEQTVELGQAPVFNIHIHLPANNDTNASKMYLPRIQPIIHVHFDELANKLRNKASKQEGGLSEKYLQTLIKQITPKFGNILFHHKNNGQSNSKEINYLTPNQDLRGKDTSIELESCRTDTRKKQNLRNSNKSGDKGPNKKTQRINGGDKLSNVIYNGHPVKLKKAVVVLEDVLQPSFCKSGRVGDLQEKITVSQCFSPIKIEPEPCSPRSSAYENEKSCAERDNFINSFGSTSSEFPEDEVPQKRESLASLVEGCYFSEILKKFKEKYRNYEHESLEDPNTLPEAQTLLENTNVEPPQNNMPTLKEGIWIDQSYNVDLKQEEEEDSKDWVNFQNGVRSHEIEKHSCQNSFERNTETNDQSNSVDPSVEESRNGVDQMQDGLGIERAINPFHTAEVELDDKEITTRNNLSSDVVQDLGPLEFDSSNPKSDIVIKSEFNLVETNNCILADTGDKCFDLTLVKEEMVSPKEGIDAVNNERRKSRDGESGSSPKKFKRSSETAKESATKAPRAVDYIPLNYSGPTKFGVVPLSNVQGDKTHAAQNFKKDMLFGKRINRFPNPEHLLVYKLKKQQKNCQNTKP